MIVGAGHQISLVHGRRGKATLSEIVAPAFAEIYLPRTTAMGIGQRDPRSVRVAQLQDQMDMAGHQAMGQDSHARSPLPAWRDRFHNPYWRRKLSDAGCPGASHDAARPGATTRAIRAMTNHAAATAACQLRIVFPEFPESTLDFCFSLTEPP